jgi:hypothetical protein
MHPRSVVLVLAAVMFATGCKESAKEAGKTGKAGAPAAPTAAVPVSDLALLSGDAELVLGVDWQELQTSSIWKQFAFPALMKEKEVVMFVTEIKSRCGIDLAADPKHITIGVKGLDAELPDGGAVVTGLDKAKLLACPTKFKAEAEKEHTVIRTEGDTILALDSDGYGMGVTFVGDRALFMIGKSMSTQRFKDAIAGASSLASSKGFMDMHGKIDTQQTGWGFFRGATMEKEVSEIVGSKPKAVYGSVGMKNGVRAQVRARLDSAETASKTVATMLEQIEQARAMLDTADIAADGQDVKLDVGAAGAKLDALIALMLE